MNQPTILFVCAVLAAASSLVRSGEELSCEKPSFLDSYIDWTGLSVGDNLIETKRALNELNIKNCDSSSDILSKILKGRSESSDDYGDQKYQVYDKLAFWSYYSKICDLDSIELVLEICSLMHDDESLASFAQFLVPKGMIKFGHCRKSAITQLSKPSPDNEKSEKELDLFFAALLGVEEEEPTDNDMIKAAKTLSFVERNDLNVAAAVEVAKILARPESGDSFEIFDGFLSTACSGLKSGREAAMNIVALANAFSYSPKFENEKVHKWQEYTRVCLTWTRPDMRKEAVPNIKQQLGATFTERPHTEILALPEPQKRLPSRL